jgi:hypothetical protein
MFTAAKLNVVWWKIKRKTSSGWKIGELEFIVNVP